jgi:hypothetical protein
MPASPRGSREDLDDLDTARSERAERSKSLEDPGVVGTRVHTPRVGCPADPADQPGELQLASRAALPSGAQARGLSIATTADRFAVTRSTTCWHTIRLRSARTARVQDRQVGPEPTRNWGQNSPEKPQWHRQARNPARTPGRQQLRITLRPGHLTLSLAEFVAVTV